MKKRILSLALALTMALGCAAVPAFAAESKSDEMTRVTLAVKEKLGIGDEYDKFSGDCADFGVFRYWQLSWSKENGGSLDVTADNTGRIISYDRYDPDLDSVATPWNGDGYNPTFPAVTAAQVEAAAQAFLDKVLSQPESGKLDPVNLSLTGYRRAASASGTLLINGVETSGGFSLRLSLPSLTVTSYSRRQSWGMVVTGDAPSATPAVGNADAQGKLHSTLSMELRYVDGDNDAIVLRYVPTTQGSWFVDAQTGELVDLTTLPGWGNRKFAAGGAAEEDGAMNEAVPSPEAPSLSPVEQATVDQMAGTLTAEKLDELLQKIPALGLSNMTQAGASYYMDRESGAVTCRLTYTRNLAEDEIAPEYNKDMDASTTPTLRRYVTVDAMTGALKRVSTSSDYGRDSYDGDAAALAREFLSGQYPDYFAACVRKEEDGDEGYYVRQVNGVPYYSNYLRASVCKVDGAIGFFSMEWDEDARFPATDNPVGEDAALAAYAGVFETKLSYIPYPEKADPSDPQWLTYIQRLGEVKYRWVLAYVLAGDAPQGVDAVTGKVVSWPGMDPRALTYTDCANSYAKAEIEALAEYGVGFGRGDTFRPAAQVTQRDMLVLLLSALGYTYDADNMDEELENDLYNAAYSQGLLTADLRDPARAVTRMEFLKALLGGSAYGKAAQLQGIYKTGFSDAASIPESDLGYAAIGQALGIVSGDQARALNPNGTLTRQDAAVMLCRFMGR